MNSSHFGSVMDKTTAKLIKQALERFSNCGTLLFLFGESVCVSTAGFSSKSWSGPFQKTKENKNYIVLYSVVNVILLQGQHLYKLSVPYLMSRRLERDKENSSRIRTTHQEQNKLKPPRHAQCCSSDKRTNLLYSFVFSSQH